MKGKRLMTAAFALLMGMAASAQEGLLKETIAYRDTFKMDVYVNPSVKVDGGDVPVWQQKPCPMMFFHGSADRTVYPHLLHIDALNSSFSGPEIIIPTLRDLQVSYMYYVGEGYDHVMSGIPFETYGTDIMAFIHRVIYKKEKVAVKTIEEDYEGPRNLVRYYTELMGIFVRCQAKMPPSRLMTSYPSFTNF